MAFPVLPKAQLESAFKTPLKLSVNTDLQTLKQQQPRVYEDIVAYTLNPLTVPDKKPCYRAAFNPIDVGLYWETLSLESDAVCSEIVLITFENTSYIALLNILPPEFGLFSPIDPRASASFVDVIMGTTLSNISHRAKTQHNSLITTTLYNPNLRECFVKGGFREDPAGEQIVGLPLPAYFYKPI